MNQTNYPGYYENQIDLLDLFNEVVIKQLKKIIIVAIIGGLIGFGVSVYNSSKEDKIVEALLANQEEALETYEDDVTENDLRDVSNYENNKKLYELQTDYLDNSILLSLEDSSKLYSYNANIRARNVKDIDGVISTIESNVFNDEYLDTIGEELGVVNNSDHYDLSTFVGDLITVRNSSGNSSFTDTTDKTINVTFIYSDADLAKQIGDDIVKRINSLSSTIYEESGASLYVLTTTTTTTTTSLTDIVEVINNYEESISGLSTTLESEYKAFNNIQLKYYAARHPELEIKVSSGKTKNIAIGVMLGAMIVCGYYCLVYVMENRLNTMSQLTRSGFKIYGLTGSKQKGFNVNGNVVSMETINQLISLDLSKKDNKKVIIGSTLSTDEIKNVSDNISKNNKIINIYGNILNNDEFIEECKKDVSVIYIEKLHKTKMNDIKALRDFNSNYGIDCSGLVVTM